MTNDRLSLLEVEVNIIKLHLSGRHNQKTHGRRGRSITVGAPIPSGKKQPSEIPGWCVTGSMKAELMKQLPAVKRLQELTKDKKYVKLASAVDVAAARYDKLMWAANPSSSKVYSAGESLRKAELALHAHVSSSLGMTGKAKAEATIRTKYAFEEKPTIVNGCMTLAIHANGKRINGGSFAVGESSRSFYDPINNFISIKSGSPPSIIAHEVGHKIEWVKKPSQNFAWKFHAERTLGEELKPVHSKITDFSSGSSGYDDKFGRFWKDQASARYCGAFYRESGPRNSFVATTEITAMGCQALAMNPGRFAKADPEYCAYTLAMIRRYTG